MPTLLVLLHSPLAGPVTWQATADALRLLGHRVVTPVLTGAIRTGPPHHAQLAEQAAAQIRAAGGTDASAMVLVGHSGAGPLLPAVADAAGLTVRAVVFADAALPRPGRSWLDTAPVELTDQLRALARDGRLPPWDRWFPTGTVETLLPDPTLRERFLAELPAPPMSFFEEHAPVTPGWPADTPCGYLRLSTAYAAQAAQAVENDWLTIPEESDHLAMLTRPGMVAAMVDRMVSELVRTGNHPHRGAAH